MASFKNTMGIAAIELTDKVKCFCPLGQSMCTYQLTVKICPDATIPDYMDVKDFFDNKLSKVATLEACCAEVCDYFVREYDPLFVDAGVYCGDARHMPVSVSKTYCRE